jgi:hypothetical protein
MLSISAWQNVQICPWLLEKLDPLVGYFHIATFSNRNEIGMALVNPFFRTLLPSFTVVIIKATSLRCKRKEHKKEDKFF